MMAKPYTNFTVKRSLGAKSNTRTQVGKMLRAIMDGVSEIDELMEHAGMAQSTVRHWIQALRAEQVLRVSAYPPDELGRIANKQQYEFNPDRKRDAHPPPTKSGAQKSRDYRARLKANLARPKNALMNGSWIRPVKDQE